MPRTHTIVRALASAIGIFLFIAGLTLLVFATFFGTLFLAFAAVEDALLLGALSLAAGGALLIVGAMIVIVVDHWHRRVAANACRRCGYDMHGHVLSDENLRCPECGALF